ncbi:MAG: SIMPL domain-containing protein [Marinobacter sp.]|uniref:SIMPL domain-containing protein n=1 Tax=Marinobacter sp. TaxID=50741 RepID=UPI00299E2D05|nr:SIMPL domain-containing protein [Marinobacter sp.]MDX1633454.1 SIMPL domain-containing protein [Marinobacter sp.]
MPRFASRRFFTTSAAAWTLAFSPLLLAGEVSLTGQGSVQYTPDSVRLQFTASAEHPDAETATEQVSKTLAQWNQAIESYRDDLDDYSDATVNLYTRHLPVDRDDQAPDQSAVASQTVSFSTDELELLNPLIATAQDLGMEYHLGPHQFYHSDEAEFRRQALARALADARAQCQFVAAEMDMDCGEVKSLNINDGGRPMPMMMSEARDTGMSVSSIGPREVQVSVSATFVLE